MFKDYRIDPVAMKILQHNLKRLRVFMGLTQENLAEMLDISPQSIASIETGKMNVTAAVYLAMIILANRFYDSLKECRFKEIIAHEIQLDFGIDIQKAFSNYYGEVSTSNCCEDFYS